MLLPHQPTTTPSSALHHLNQRLATGLSSNTYKPYVWPHRAMGPNLLLIYLLLPPTKSPLIHYLRYPLFALIIYLSVDSTLYCRSAMVTVGYGIGLLNVFAVLWSATLIIWGDARGEFERIEERGVTSTEDGGSRRVIVITTNDQSEGGVGTGAERIVDGEVKARRGESEGKDALSLKSLNEGKDKPGSSKRVTYIWQPLPPTFPHRLDWVSDLVSNFRGLRWRHQIPSLPPPPAHIQSSLTDPSSTPPPTPPTTTPLTRTDLIRRDLLNFLLVLLALDILKTITLRDPYFWGLPPTTTPSPFPYPVLTRTALSFVFVYASLLAIFLLSPLVFGVLLGPKAIGQHAWPWLYPPFFGSVMQVYRKGIAGFWAGWWHQLFRYSFDSAGEFACRVLGWEKETQKGTLLRVVVAFACSGALHGCASYTTLGDTKPLSGSLLFFMLQPVGIVAQRAASGWLRSVGVRDKTPAWLRGVGNLVVVAFWCYLVGPMIADDFAATGVWLYEPIPISPIRALRGEELWRWGGRWMRWYSADRWWRSGLAC